MKPLTTRRIGFAAVLLLSAFAFGQENERKQEDKKPAPKGKSAPKAPTPAPNGGGAQGPQNQGQQNQGRGPTNQGREAPTNQGQPNRGREAPTNQGRPSPASPAPNSPAQTNGNREGQTNQGRPSPIQGREGQGNGGQPNGGQPNGGRQGNSAGPGAAPANVNRNPGNNAQAPANNFNRGGAQNSRGNASRPTPQGSREVSTRSGGSVTMRSNGRPAVVRASNGVEVHHGLTGRTEIVRESPDHARVVAVRGGYGYVQRPYSYGGHPYLARTYVVGGRPYQSFYRGYSYRGAYLEVYAPVRYYPVGFYGYVSTPWARPIAYTWGWGASPWVRFYGGYFTPYPVYASAPMWLTDYLIAESLNAAYQSQLNAQAGAYQPLPPPPGGPVALSPEVKQAVADEVQRQLAIENAEARANAQNLEPDPSQSSIARMLSDNTAHVFVVGDGLDLVNNAGQECAVTEGDVLQLAGPPPPDSSTATLIVLASKGGQECRTGNSVAVALDDLQDMQNHMRRTLDAGLADLQAHQNGLPMPPQAALAMPIAADFSNGAPPPDPSAANQIDAQLQQGNQLEQQTLNEAGSAPGQSSQPATISLGQSIDQVVANLGQPTQVVDLGAKKIYVYPNLKVTFNNGQVADVE